MQSPVMSPATSLSDSNTLNLYIYYHKTVTGDQIMSIKRISLNFVSLTDWIKRYNKDDSEHCDPNDWKISNNLVVIKSEIFVVPKIICTSTPRASGQ